MSVGQPVLVEIDGSVGVITLNRPGAGNSIDMALAVALEQAVGRVASDAAIRCVVLTGSGKLFCGGGDLSAFAEMSNAFPAYLHDLAVTLHRSVELLATMNKPLVVLVNGPAAGAGMSLAISGDIVLSSNTAHFTPAYSSVGLTPDGGMSWLLPRLVGLRAAQEIILTNRRVSAKEAADLGMVTRVVPPEELPGEGLRLARTIADGPVDALAGARRLMSISFGNELVRQLDQEVAAITQAAEGAEAAEGISAFLERRKPVFQS